MYRISPMPLTAGLVRLDRLRGSISILESAEREPRAQSIGLDYPVFDLPPVSAGNIRQHQRKPAPIDLRLRMDLRDVRLYVDVIVDMLLQSLDSRAYSSGFPQSGRFTRQLASNPDAKRILDKLLERAVKLDTGGKLSAEEIIRMLMNQTPVAEGERGMLPKLPLTLKSIAVTRERSANQRRPGRRVRLMHEARKLVRAHIRLPGQKAEIITKQKDETAALQVVVPHTDTVERDIATNQETVKSLDDRRGTRQEVVHKAAEAKKTAAQPAFNEAPQNFAAAKVEYLQSYPPMYAKTPTELAEKLVDAKTLSKLSGEAIANLNRMLEEGKLAPANGKKPNTRRANVAETVTTYAELYPNGRQSEKPGQEYNIIVQNLYYADKMPDATHIRLSALSAASSRSDATLRYAMFGRGVSGLSGNGVVTERKIANWKPIIQHRNGVQEKGGMDKSAMFFAESPAAEAAAKMEARQSMMAQQTSPVYDAPDMTKLKKELATQAGRELDDIIRKKLNVDKLTDKIYRNLESRLRSERIRRGIV